MRIAVTGTHGSGKSTLIADFAAARPDYECEQEPYWALAQQGVVFADGATVPDLEQQLDASAELILARRDDRAVIFDRCPLDFIAYLEIVSEREGTTWEPSGRQLARIEKALGSLDLLVFLPLSRPDEIAIEIELPKLRADVDARLKRWVKPDQMEMLVSPPPRVLALRGSRDERLAKLIAAIGV